MKRLGIFFIVLTIVMLGGCSNNNKEEKGKVSSDGRLVVNKTLYDCEKFLLTCNAIKKDGIEFECKNKTSEELKVYLNISLDGIEIPLSSNSEESEIGAKKTKIFVERGSIDLVEHKYMSVSGVVFMDNDSISFDVCNLDIGGKKNEIKVKSGDVLYSTDDLNVEFIEANAEGLKFKVQNKRKKSITFGADELKINGEDKDYASNVVTIPPCTIGFYEVSILDDNENYYASDFKLFKGIFKAFVDGEGTVDRFKVSYPSNAKYNITKEERILYTNVLNTMHSIGQIHLNEDSFELLGAVATEKRTTILLSYKGSDGKTYKDYFWKDLAYKKISNRFGKENYQGHATPVNELDLDKIKDFENSGEYEKKLISEEYIDINY